MKDRFKKVSKHLKDSVNEVVNKQMEKILAVLEKYEKDIDRWPIIISACGDKSANIQIDIKSRKILGLISEKLNEFGFNSYLTGDELNLAIDVSMYEVDIYRKTEDHNECPLVSAKAMLALTNNSKKNMFNKILGGIHASIKAVAENGRGERRIKIKAKGNVPKDPVIIKQIIAKLEEYGYNAYDDLPKNEDGTFNFDVDEFTVKW